MRIHRSFLVSVLCTSFIWSLLVVGAVAARNRSVLSADPSAVTAREDSVAGDEDTLSVSADDVQHMGIRVQRCLARFEGEAVLLNIEFRGNLVTGRALSILAVDAEAPPEEGSDDEGLLADTGLYKPQDKYAPRGFLQRLRGRFKIPFMKRLSNKYSGKVLKADAMLSDTDLSLEVTPEQLPGRVAVVGYEDFVYLPDAYARETEAGTFAGSIARDADGDRILNVFDPHPFYFDKEENEEEDEDEYDEDDVDDDAQDEAEDQSQDEAEDRAEDRADDKVDERTRKAESLQDNTRFQKLDVKIPKPKNVGGHVARRGFSWSKFFAKPWIALPALAVVYVGVDKVILDDGGSRRTGVLVDN